MMTSANFVYDDTEAIADGTIVDISALELFHADRLVDRCSRPVWMWLARELPSARSYTTVLKAVFASAVDIAEKGEPGGWLYVTANRVRLPDPLCAQCKKTHAGNEVWLPMERMYLERNEGDCLTLMFPKDR